MPESRPKSFHVGLSVVATYPLPITFYVSPELLADDGYSDADVAKVLFNNFCLAIKNHREILRDALG